MPKLSASDAISPAIEQTRRILLEPFRWGLWLRYAVLGLFVQQFGCNANFNSFSNLGNLGKQQPQSSEFMASPGLPEIFHNMAWTAGLIATLIVLFVLLILVHGYISSVSRFILFDSVLRGTCRLREGWSRWQAQGLRLFGMQMGIGLITLTGAGILIGVPVGVIAVAASGGHSSAGLGAGAILLVLFLIPVGILLVLAIWLVSVLVGDFAVPIMALEGAGAWAALGRAWQLARAEKGAVAFYLFMRFVLVIAAAVIFGIIGVIVSLILLAPVIGVVVAAIVGGGAAGLSWTPFTITLAVVAGVLLFLPLMYVLSFVRTPGTVFFPAYAMHFFAGRYEPLGMILYPPPPPVVQPLPPVFAPPLEVPVEPSMPEGHIPDAGTPPEDGGAETI